MCVLRERRIHTMHPFTDGRQGRTALTIERAASFGPLPLFTISGAGNTTVTAEFALPDDRVGRWQAGCFMGAGCDPRVGLAAELTVG